MNLTIYAVFARLWVTSGKLVVLALLAALALVGDMPVEGQQPQPLQVGAPAPDFEGGTDWLNTAKAISLEDLRGRIVLLDFWTLC